MPAPGQGVRADGVREFDAGFAPEVAEEAAADHVIVCARTLAVAIAAYRVALNDPPQGLPF